MEFEPIETQEQLDAVLKDRLERERKKVREKVLSEFSDYEDIKKKAQAYDEAQEANKTELQKAQERISELEGAAKKRDEADRQREARAKVAKEKGLPENLIMGADEEAMNAFADQLLEFVKVQKPAAPIDKTAGSFPQGNEGNDEKREFARELLGSRD